MNAAAKKVAKKPRAYRFPTADQFLDEIEAREKAAAALEAARKGAAK